MQNGWVPRHEDNKPKTIKQIHKEAEQEEQQKQALLQRASQEQRSSYRRPRTPSLLSGSVSEEGWRGAALNNTVDPTRMKLTKHQVEDIQLGPGGRPGYATWQRGSSGGGSRTPSLEREKPPRSDRSCLLCFVMLCLVFCCVIFFLGGECILPIFILVVIKLKCIKL